ncbi:MAG TPA: hypothetical protein VK988_09010 [Acidimicrobiales bacterium]|nr:hypothetical protein [Acidimicrobiales bacterium]
MSPERLFEPFSEASFRSGLAIGVVALLVLVVVARLWRMRWRRACPVAGLFLAAAGAIAVIQADRPVPGLVGGLIVLGAAGGVVDLKPKSRPFLPVLALPGTWMIATSIEVDQSWVALAVGAAVAAGGALVVDFDHRWSQRPLAPSMICISLVGVFLTVPETKEALPIVGAALPLALIGWPTNLASLGAGGSLTATGLLAWTTAQGGTFRAASIVGGLACLGMLVAEPLGRLVQRNRSRRRLPRSTGVLLGVVAVHLMVVFVAARVAGLGDDVTVAVVISALVLAAGVGASLAIRSLAVRPRPQEG